MSDGQRAFMMGNALVVGLVERVGRELMDEISGSREAVAIRIEMKQAIAS